MSRLILILVFGIFVTSCHTRSATSNWAYSQRIALMQTFPWMYPETALQVYPDVDERLTTRLSWPITLDQAATCLIDEMSDADKKKVRDTKKEDLIDFGFGWGLAIRHEFGLRRGNTVLLADCHKTDPEDASMVIIKEVWMRLRLQ